MNGNRIQHVRISPSHAKGRPVMAKCHCKPMLWLVLYQYSSIFVLAFNFLYSHVT